MPPVMIASATSEPSSLRMSHSVSPQISPALCGSTAPPSAAKSPYVYPPTHGAVVEPTLQSIGWVRMLWPRSTYAPMSTSPSAAVSSAGN